MRASGDRRPSSDQAQNGDWEQNESDRRTQQLVAGAAGAAIGLVCLAVLAVLVVVAMPDAAEPPPRRDRNADVSWDGLDSRARSTIVLLDSRVSSRPSRLRETTSLIQNASRDYAVDRAAEVRAEIARIDADPWRSQRDIDRRSDLVNELGRLSR
jgi:hypothetical protein